jgi:redox-sensitive bicupin YhaK (pirin superfamily)
MIKIRPSGKRGYADHGWLQSWHSFSFADYYDPDEMGWGPLRVINEDIVAPGQGFPLHGHRDMEIVTVILDGALEHRDDLGNGTVIVPGEVQRMSAGTGVRHSEFNPSPDRPTHLLQIWIAPASKGIAPGYEQRRIAPLAAESDSGAQAGAGWQLLASPDGAEGSVRIHQNARLLRAASNDATPLTYALAAGRLAYVQVIAGGVVVNGVTLTPGDGARIADETQLQFAGADAAATTAFDFLLFDLPA